MIMPSILGLRPEAGKTGFLNLEPENRDQIYRYLLLDRGDNAIPILSSSRSNSTRHQFAISMRSLSAQLLRACHQILVEAYPILYHENKFTIYFDNNTAGRRAIPFSIMDGKICELRSITISIQTIRSLNHNLEGLLLSLPFLQVLCINGNLLRTIDFYRHLDCKSHTAMERCISQSIGLIFSAFGGKELFTSFINRHPSLRIEYTFGVAVDLILPATGELVKGVPHVSTMREENITEADKIASGIRLTCERKWTEDIRCWNLRKMWTRSQE
jgi:hypothetical protein